MLKLKAGVRCVGMKPELMLAVAICHDTYDKWGGDCIITSMCDGTHSSGSLHYSGAAIDLRTRHIPDTTAASITKELKNSLGVDFDVVLEDNHIHVEFQPKSGYP